ncbi:hypothetical protein C8J56DRAFT_398038 [Mycena floridula]|nr:hypothetical protein C8J56DRAFT_398038 [Mycena floridula]
MPKGVSTKGKSKATDPATPVGGQLSTVFELTELENVVPEGPVRRSLRGQGNCRPLASFNPAEYTDRSPGGRQHKGVLYRLPPGSIPQASSSLSQPAASVLPSVPAPSSSSILPPKLRQPTEQSRKRKGETAPSSIVPTTAKPKRKSSVIAAAASDFSSNAAIPHPSTTKPVLSSSFKPTPSSLAPLSVPETEPDSLDGEQFDLGKEELRDLSEDFPSKVLGWNQISGQDDQDESATGSDGISVDEIPRIDIKTYLVRKRAHSGSQSKPGPSKVPKRGEIPVVSSSLAPDVSQDIDRDLSATFNSDPPGTPAAISSKPLKSALKPQKRRLTRPSSREKDHIIILHDGEEIAPEVMADWESRIKVVTADGRTMAVDRDTYGAFQQLIAMAATQVAADRAVIPEASHPASQQRDQGRDDGPKHDREIGHIKPSLALNLCQQPLVVIGALAPNLRSTEGKGLPSLILLVTLIVVGAPTRGPQIAGQRGRLQKWRPRDLFVLVRQAMDTAQMADHATKNRVAQVQAPGLPRGLEAEIRGETMTCTVGQDTHLSIIIVIRRPLGTGADLEKTLLAPDPGTAFVVGMLIRAQFIVTILVGEIIADLGLAPEIVATTFHSLALLLTPAQGFVVGQGRLLEIERAADLSRRIAGRLPEVANEPDLPRVVTFLSWKYQRRFRW